jgi:hypothetical protein
MTQLLDIADMPRLNPRSNTTGRRERDITDNKVLPHPTWVAECKEHGAMNCVNPERTIWRCLTCNVGAYRPIVFGEKE